MTRFLWTALLALCACLSAGRGGRAFRTEPSRGALHALDAFHVLGAPAQPTPGAIESLTLPRRLAPRAGERQQGHHPGAAPPPAAPWAARAATRHASVSAARLTVAHAPPALAFPYDATAPPGRRCA